MTLFQFNHYGLTENKFSSDIVRVLSKRNRFSIGRCAKFVGHIQCLNIISQPAIECFSLIYNLNGFKSGINRHKLTVGSF